MDIDKCCKLCIFVSVLSLPSEKAGAGGLPGGRRPRGTPRAEEGRGRAEGMSPSVRKLFNHMSSIRFFKIKFQDHAGADADGLALMMRGAGRGERGAASGVFEISRRAVLFPVWV